MSDTLIDFLGPVCVGIVIIGLSIGFILFCGILFALIKELRDRDSDIKAISLNFIFGIGCGLVILIFIVLGVISTFYAIIVFLLIYSLSLF